MRDFLYSRIAALLWSILFTLVLLGDVEVGWQSIGERFPFWRWLVAAYLFLILHCYLLHREARLEEDVRRGVRRPPVSTRVMRIVVGGRIGLVSWALSFLALGVGWLLSGVTGLAVGAVIAKISYVPWIVGIVREARRRPALI